MNAIRQIVEVKNHQLNIELPKDFDSEMAEVIIFPKDNDLFQNVSEEEKQLILKRIESTKIEDTESWKTLRNNFIK